MCSSHLILHSHMRAETSQILTQAHTGSHGATWRPGLGDLGTVGARASVRELQWPVLALKARGEGEGDFHGG